MNYDPPAGVAVRQEDEGRVAVDVAAGALRRGDKGLHLRGGNFPFFDVRVISITCPIFLVPLVSLLGVFPVMDHLWKSRPLLLLDSTRLRAILQIHMAAFSPDQGRRPPELWNQLLCHFSFEQGANILNIPGRNPWPKFLRGLRESPLANSGPPCRL